MLHATNGRSVQICDTGIGGQVVFWDDALHEGPVPRMPLEELSELRAHFVAQSFGLQHEQVQTQFDERDSALGSFREHDELVLWFEHDLYDQLQLIQILSYLAGQRARSTRISLIQADRYLGPMSPAQLALLFETRQRVTDEQFRIASEAWQAFTAPDPVAMMELMARDTTSLPYLNPALRRHLEQFPGKLDGLSRTERQILQVVERGARTMAEAFRADAQLEQARFMGDSWYALHLRELGRGRNPLLHVDEHGTVMKITLDLTNAGRNVLAGRADHLQLNGIDRWLGGIHLSDPAEVWRWDGFIVSR